MENARHSQARTYWRRYAVPLGGLLASIWTAASTWLTGEGSGTRGPPVTGVIHTCIIGDVVLLTVPASHAPRDSLADH